MSAKKRVRLTEREQEDMIQYVLDRLDDEEVEVCT